jgi:CheY-like chemotaxis protein
MEGKAARGAPLRVLVVDDEQPIRTICRVNLEAAGMEVVEAADGTEALDRVHESPPALVVLDAMMPGLDGWTVAERLAGDATTREIPVVFLSARAGREDRRRAGELGAVGYVTKPFDPLGLADVLRLVHERIARGEREQLREEVAGEP